MRDILLGITPYELDLEIYDINPLQFEEIAKKIGAKGVGKSFFVYKWKNFDLSLPRIESKVAPGHQGFTVQLTSDEKNASKRRDFTMNTLMLDITQNTILDYWNGQKDIQNKTIRLVDNEKFQEDPLRVLRGIQFASRFGFMIEKCTLKTMKIMPLNELSKTRIFWELEKLFNSHYPEIGVYLGNKIKLWQKLLHVELTDEKIDKIQRRLVQMNPYILDHLKKYIFLYVFINEADLDMKNTLYTLDAPKEYEKYLLHSPYLKTPISNKELLKIAIDMPLKKWPGICQKNLQKQAQNLHVYDNKFDGDIKAKDVIEDGFSGKDIAKEIRRRKLNKIDTLLS